MSSDASIDIRALIFINRDAEESYRSLPDEVRQAADARTSAIQNNERLPRGWRESLKGELAGIDEVIYILDAGMKKSPHGREIPRPQVDRLLVRKKAAREDYAEHKATYQAEKQKRLERRKAWEATRKPEPH